MTRARKGKVVKAWAVFENDELAVWDHRVPIFWQQRVAEQAAKRMTFEHEVRRVTITVLP